MTNSEKNFPNFNTILQVPLLYISRVQQYMHLHYITSVTQAKRCCSNGYAVTKLVQTISKVYRKITKKNDLALIK